MIELKYLDTASNAAPFVEGAFDNGIELLTMDVASMGAPFVRSFGGSLAPDVYYSFVPWICLM